MCVCVFVRVRVCACLTEAVGLCACMLHHTQGCNCFEILHHEPHKPVCTKAMWKLSTGRETSTG